MTQENYWNLDRIMRLIIGVVIAIGVVWLIRYLSNVLLPFFAACFIAYLLQPLVELNRKWLHLKGRMVAVGITLVEVGLVIVALAIIFIPPAMGELEQLARIVRDISTGKRAMPAFYGSINQLINHYFDPSYLQSQFTLSHVETLLSKGTSLVQQTINLLMHTLEWALMLVYVLFILIDYPQISRGFKLIIPHRYRARGMIVVKDVQQSMNHYFRGQGLVALCAAVLYCIGFKIAGLPLAIPMGVLVGILFMIPYFQYVTLIPVAIIALITALGGHDAFWPLMGKCLLVYAVSQSICDYILMPRVMGKEMGLNAAVILLSLSVWGSLLGIIGMIIALPVTALMMAYYERYISNPHPRRRRERAAAAAPSGSTEAGLKR